MKKNDDFDLPREDHLDDYIKCTPEQILGWLYQANRFFAPFKKDIKADPKFQQKLRKGDI